MNAKIHLTVGVDAKGNVKALYLGVDGQAAKDTYEKSLNESDFESVQLYSRLRPDRRGDVAKAKAQVQAAAEFRKAEAEAKAKAATGVDPEAAKKAQEAEAKRLAAEAKKAEAAEAKKKAAEEAKAAKAKEKESKAK